MNLVERLAGLPSVQREVHQGANKVARTAKALAAGHGGLAGDIKVERVGLFDVDVVLQHEGALAIEVGHVDKVFDSGWVPGLHIMRDAANLTT